MARGCAETCFSSFSVFVTSAFGVFSGGLVLLSLYGFVDYVTVICPVCMEAAVLLTTRYLVLVSSCMRWFWFSLAFCDVDVSE